jgi:hypothetical protein
LDAEGMNKFQSMIGSLQWAVSLGRFDVQTATMTMSWFSAAPRQGHLDQLKWMYSYLRKYASAAICVQVEEPDFSELPNQEFDWCETVYGKVEEMLAPAAPKPLGKATTTVHYTDANLQYDLLTGRAATGILHLLNLLQVIGTAKDRQEWKQPHLDQNYCSKYCS